MSNGPDHPGTILVVDDDESTRAAFEAILAGAGYSVVGAPDGTAALDSLRVSAFDAVVTDLNMPWLGGVDLCRTIRSAPALSRVPVIAVSSDPEESAAPNLFDFYLRKPVPPDQLLGAVSALAADPSPYALECSFASSDEEGE